MGADRQLWTGPHGARLADRALGLMPAEADGLWIVASTWAGRRATDLLARRMVARPRVWSWGQLWQAIREQSREGPAALSTTACRAALGEAVAAARPADRADSPGFRRRLAARIAAWTRAELEPDGEPPDADDPSALADWSTFGRYRQLLNRLDAEDPEGLAIWASKTLRVDPPPRLRRFGLVALLDPWAMGPPGWRALMHLSDRAEGVLVTLPYVNESALADVYTTVGSLRDKLIEWRFEETEFEAEPNRPEGLSALEAGLFRDDAHDSPKIEATAGLSVVGAADGEGIARAVAARVRRRLIEGASPGEIVVLVPCRDEHTSLIVETLRAWGIAAKGGPSARAAADPALSALRLAASIAVDGWPADRLVRLLRHGRVRIPDAGRLARARAAGLIRDARVYRGKAPIREALRRAGSPPSGRRATDPSAVARASRAMHALPLFDHLADALAAVDRPRAWADHAVGLMDLAEALGLDGPGLDAASLALDEHGAVLDGLGVGGRRLEWPEFIDAFNALVDALELPPADAPGGVLVATIAEARGLRADHVLLANLGEGTLPARSAIDRDAEAAAQPVDFWDDPRPPTAMARELHGFLGVVGSADLSLTLLYPTADEAGGPRLPAGVVDEVKAAMSEQAWAEVHLATSGLDPLPGDPLDGTPAEARAAAVALAAFHRDVSTLSSLAADPPHRPALLGVAAALRVAHHRQRPGAFGAFDGHLGDPRIGDRLAAEFGPDRPTSPSQLESLAACPFQFYQRYVLNLAPADDAGELAEDRAARGSFLHRALESLHARLAAVPDPLGRPAADRVAAEVDAVILGLLDAEGPPSSDVDAGLRHIEALRLRESGRRYADQFGRYAEASPGHRVGGVEVSFGDPNAGPAGLTLGRGAEAVLVRGTIDRIDVSSSGDHSLFRIIDYKSGAEPKAKGVAAGLLLQLPLYALAVERLRLAGEEARPADVGYWALGAKGYKVALNMETPAKGGPGWEDLRGNLEAFVLALVARLRAGDFPVSPREDECEDRCDYRQVCRVRQARNARKTWAEAPSLDRPR